MKAITVMLTGGAVLCIGMVIGFVLAQKPKQLQPVTNVTWTYTPWLRAG